MESGQIFCGKCSAEIIPGKLLGFNRNIRVCDYCANLLKQYRTENDPFADFLSQTPGVPVLSDFVVFFALLMHNDFDASVFSRTLTYPPFYFFTSTFKHLIAHAKLLPR